MKLCSTHCTKFSSQKQWRDIYQRSIALSSVWSEWKKNNVERIYKSMKINQLLLNLIKAQDNNYPLEMWITGSASLHSFTHLHFNLKKINGRLPPTETSVVVKFISASWLWKHNFIYVKWLYNIAWKQYARNTIFHSLIKGHRSVFSSVHINIYVVVYLSVMITWE